MQEISWTIGFWNANPFRYHEVKVDASDSRDALVKAIAQVEMQGDERFHCIHMNTSDKWDYDPNEETQEAMTELETKECERFDCFEEFMKDLEQ